MGAHSRRVRAQVILGGFLRCSGDVVCGVGALRQRSGASHTDVWNYNIIIDRTGARWDHRAPARASDSYGLASELRADALVMRL